MVQAFVWRRQRQINNLQSYRNDDNLWRRRRGSFYNNYVAFNGNPLSHRKGD